MLALRRHRMLSVLLLLLTFSGACIAFVKQPLTYRATSSVAFIPSQSFAQDSGGGNRYLAFTTSVNQMGDVIRYQVTGSAERSVLVSAGYTSSFTITDAADTAAPILLVSVTGHDEAGVEKTLSGVDAAITAKLAAMQIGIKTYQTVLDKVLTYTASPTHQSGGKVRAAVVLLVVGVLLSLGILLIVDSVRGSGRHKAGEAPRAVSLQHPQPSAYDARSGSRHWV